MEDLDLKTLVAECKLNAKELVRLFDTETNGLVLPTSSSGASSSSSSSTQNLVINSNESRANVGKIRTHMAYLLGNCMKMEAYALKRDLQRETVEVLTTENVAIKRAYLDEKRRTASLYLSLGDSIATQQAQGAELRDHKQRLRNLQKESRKAQRAKLEADIAIQKLSTEIRSLSEKSESNGSTRVNGTKDKRCHGSKEGQPAGKRAKLAHAGAGTGEVLGTGNGSNAEHGGLQASRPSQTSSSSAPPSSSSSSSSSSGDPQQLAVDVVAGASSSSSSSVAVSSKYVLPGAASSKSQDREGNRPGRPKTEGKKDKAYLVGSEIQKAFLGTLYRGKVTAFSMPYYRITYDDGDVEEMTLKEVEAHLCKKPPKKKGGG